MKIKPNININLFRDYLYKNLPKIIIKKIFSQFIFYHIRKFLLFPNQKDKKSCLNKKNKILTIAEVNLVLINKLNFSIIRKRPDFLSEAFSKLNG